MKKKIFCIIAVVLCLVSVLTMAVSAQYDECYRDYYNWQYHWFSSGSTAKNVGVGESVIPETFYDTFYTSDTDYADRYYLLGFKTDYYDADDKGAVEKAVIDATYDVIEVTTTSPYYRDECMMFAYHYQATWNESPIKRYDPYTDFDYTDVYVINYFKYDYQLTDNYSVTQTIVQKPTEANYNQNIYAYQFQKVGRVSCETLIVFYDNTNGQSASINRKCSINVEQFTDSEKDNYQYGYDSGFVDGYNKALIDTAGEVDYSIRGLINAICEAPFRFIDSAFNFEVFGINVANGIRVIFTLMLITFVCMACVKTYTRFVG